MQKCGLKTVMILGANDGQLPMINICKEKGYRTITVSPKGEYPGFQVADKSVFMDTRDMENILKCAIDEDIDAIVTDQTDVAVESVAYVAEKMGLTGIGIETAERFVNKYEMRKAAKAAGINVPEFDQATSVEEAIRIADKIGYPVIMKPVDSSGSRGVRKVDSLLDIKENFENTKSKSKRGIVIVEKFIAGKEYLADGFAMDYKYVTLDVGEKEFFDVPNIYVSKMCMFSSAALTESDRVMAMVKETNDSLINAFKLSFGITHAEYIYSEAEDKVYLVECAARGGGVFLSSDITPNASGFNTNEALIEYITEGTKKIPQEKELLKKVSGWVCFSFPDGVISEISGVEETKNIEGVDKVILDKIYVGMPTKELVDDSGKYGPVLFTGKNKEECYRIVNKVRNTLQIRVMTSGGEKGAIW